ncbi:MULTISPECIES: DUF3969 family protein [Deinococcus]|jgi:hypothetical protein|uniref:Uncharacterized protein n=2 Tax=Deinococcus soli (ex Cha et al. 2016) TaxID=1309411 RepID=A0A0F7JKT5_9DEIO|nr:MULTISPECIES: DUF3969 family protein [Deinococcus]AKH16871.1 hypothetical protein SY84_07160 [Deinococcus soli (ex Cha et al. 2016)]MDK2012292.1 DUF3969 family protein [Deinococcus sp. 43]MDR6219780.1 hypothetical protein [Deinococcus soli (ex Cha et al. 2016)]MDR6329620.1 hypothetical protein [Deinococcus soli (ex Cha et al. 2016)]MDR6752687.1 hypothetical protein [Deinococcus soli (ex Cha et al. 2016)]
MTEAAELQLIFQSSVDLERWVLTHGVGFLYAIRQGVMAPIAAESELFKPAYLHLLEKKSCSLEVCDFVQRGFFLDDVQHLVSEEALQYTVDEMLDIAVRLLRERPKDIRVGRVSLA